MNVHPAQHQTEFCTRQRYRSAQSCNRDTVGRCVQLLQLVFPWAPKIHMSQYSTGIQYNIFITLYITRTFHHFHAQSDITPTAEVYKTVFLFVYSHRAAAHQLG